MSDDDNSEEYFERFERAEVYYKDLPAALLMREYKKSVGDIGKHKFEVGDTVMVKSMFTRHKDILPPWYISEGVVINISELNVKVAIEMDGKVVAMWIPKWTIIDVLPSGDKKLAEVFKDFNDIISTETAVLESEYYRIGKKIADSEAKDDIIPKNKSPKVMHKETYDTFRDMLEEDDEFVAIEYDDEVIMMKRDFFDAVKKTKAKRKK